MPDSTHDEAVTSEFAELIKTVNSGEQQLSSRMGIEIVEYTPDRVVATMPVAGNRQPYGLLHGGANAVLAEQVGSIAAALGAGPDRIALGLELICTHHRPATEGLVTAVSSRLHQGRTTATYDVEITDEQGRRTCSARLTCSIRDKA
ncbi:hotdog fold thioesterase [Saccharopolyspora tripterygii]